MLRRGSRHDGGVQQPKHFGPMLKSEYGTYNEDYITVRTQEVGFSPFSFYQYLSREVLGDYTPADHIQQRKQQEIAHFFQTPVELEQVRKYTVSYLIHLATVTTLWVFHMLRCISFHLHFSVPACGDCAWKCNLEFNLAQVSIYTSIFELILPFDQPYERKCAIWFNARGHILWVLLYIAVCGCIYGLSLHKGTVCDKVVCNL